MHRGTVVGVGAKCQTTVKRVKSRVIKYAVHTMHGIMNIDKNCKQAHFMPYREMR